MSEKVILYLAANPKETARLRLADELGEIRKSLRGASLRDRFRLEVVMSADQKEIRRAVLDYEPCVVHFSGHGTKDAEIIITEDDGGVQYVGAQALVPFFEIFSGYVECVVLSSCYTEPLAKQIGQHVDYVVGMKDVLHDESAIEYATGFYDALFSGRSVEEAHSLGRNAIRWPELPGHLVPVLYIAEDVTNGSNKKPVIELASPYPERAVWAELSRLYAHPTAARALLSKVGFPRDRMPLFSAGNAAEFWAEVRDHLIDGAVEGVDLANLLEEAASDFPGNAALKRTLER